MYVGVDPTKKTSPFRIDLIRKERKAPEKPKNALGMTYDDETFSEQTRLRLDEASKNYFRQLLQQGVPQGAQDIIHEILQDKVFVQKQVVIPEGAKSIVRHLAAREIFEQTFLSYEKNPDAKKTSTTITKDSGSPRLDVKLLHCLAKETPGVFADLFEVHLRDTIEREHDNLIWASLWDGKSTQQALYPLQIILLLKDKENKPPPLSLVKAVFEANPEAMGVDRVSGYGATPLALACLNGCSFDVIQFLYSKAPTAVAIAGGKNFFCLHFACHNSHDVVGFLLDVYPDAAKQCAKPRRRQAYYPLDLAIMSGAPIELIKRLSHAYPERVTDVNVHHAEPLFLALQHGRDLEVVEFLYQMAPESVAVDIDDRTPLLAAVCNQSPQVIRYILARAPPPVHFTCTFLHSAMWHGTPESIAFIIDQWPWMTTTRYEPRGLPIHALLANSNGIRLDILRLLLERNIETLTMKNREGHLPLHSVCGSYSDRNNVDEAIWTILRYSAEHFHSVEGFGDLPSEAFLNFQLTNTCQKGKLPLDYYLENVFHRPSENIVQKLMVPKECFSQYTHELLQKWENSRSSQMDLSDDVSG